MQSRREMWARLICDSASAGRYLLPGNDLEYAPTVFEDGQVDIQDFLMRLDDRGGSREVLASAYWLSQPVVRTFLLNDLPSLLRNLGHGSLTSPPSIEPTFKGAVLWQETIMGRFSGIIPRGRYLVSIVEKSADLPENRLLKLFLSRIVKLSAELGRRGTGTLPNQFAIMRDAAERALSNSYLQAVKLEHRSTARMIQTARRNRDHRYSRLAQLSQDFEQAVIRGKWGQMIAMLSKGWLAPINSEDLFELYSLILLMETLKGDLGFGPPESYGLIQRGRASVASYVHPMSGVHADVYFDQTPRAIIGCSSEYLDTVAAHDGVSGQERRPDILLRLTTPSSERILLIEVKESEDPSYIRDSLYKVFGYIHDFSSIWAHCPEQSPKAVVVFPTGVAPKTIPGREVIMISADRTSDLSVSVATLINGLMALSSGPGVRP